MSCLFFTDICPVSSYILYLSQLGPGDGKTREDSEILLKRDKKMMDDSNTCSCHHLNKHLHLRGRGRGYSIEQVRRKHMTDFVFPSLFLIIWY